MEMILWWIQSGYLTVMRVSKIGFIVVVVCWYPNAQITNTGTGQRKTGTSLTPIMHRVLF